MRDFNTAGPARPEDHCCVPPLDRVDLQVVRAPVTPKVRDKLAKQWEKKE